MFKKWPGIMEPLEGEYHESLSHPDMVPGSVKVAQEVLDADQMNYGLADLESEFIELYNHTETNLKIIMSTKNEVYIYVYDLNEDCPIVYPNDHPEWNSSIYTKIMD